MFPRSFNFYTSFPSCRLLHQNTHKGACSPKLAHITSVSAPYFPSCLKWQICLDKIYSLFLVRCNTNICDLWDHLDGQLNSDNIYTSDITMLTSLTRFNKFIDLTLTSLISLFSRTQNVHVIVILLVFAFLHTLVVSLFYFYQSF